MAGGPPPFDWNKLFSKENRPKTIIAIVAVVALIVVFSLAGIGNLPSPAANPGGMLASGGATPNAGGEPTGNAGPTGSGPVPLTPVSAGQCQTSAPDGWTVLETNPNGTIFSLTSADHSMVAVYGGVGMAPVMTPSQMVQQMIGSMTSAPVNVLTDGESFGDYRVMKFSSGAFGGYALYYTVAGIPDYTLPAAAQSFVLITRIAMGANGDNHSLATAGSVAAAIRCHAIFIPKPMDNTDRASGHGAGTSAKCSSGGGCDDSDLAGTYNVQLGTGWAHDSLGRNYNVDVTTDWNDNGPDGPGYYANVGGTKEKLVGGIE